MSRASNKHVAGLKEYQLQHSLMNTADAPNMQQGVCIYGSHDDLTNIASVVDSAAVSKSTVYSGRGGASRRLTHDVLHIVFCNPLL